MTDEELIARLRNPNVRVWADGVAAADRIGELTNEAAKRINQLAVLVDFARRAERYAKDTGNKFLAEKARATLTEIKGESQNGQ